MKIILNLLALVMIVWSNTVRLDNFYFTSVDVDTSENGNIIYDTSHVPYCGGVFDSIQDAGIYRLTSTIPTKFAGNYLLLGPSPYGLELKVGGKVLYRWGNLDNIKCYANYRSEVIFLDSCHFSDGDASFEVDFITDGARIAFPDFWIGDYDEIKSKDFWISTLNSSFIQMTVGIGLFSFLFLIIYYALSRKYDSQFLFLSLFSLSLVASYNMFVFNSPAFDHVLLFKIARIGGVMMSLTMFLFITSLTKLLNKITYRLIVFAAFVPYVVLILREETKYGINIVFTAASHTLIFPLLIVGLILMIVSMVKQFKVEVVLIFIPYLLLMGAVFSDLGYIIEFTQPPFWKIPYGYLAILMGGVFTVLYSKTKLSHKYEQGKKRAEEELLEQTHELELERRNNREFLSDFTRISHQSEIPFSQLMEDLKDTPSYEDLDQVHSLYTQFFITSHNMVFLDKIKTGEFYLWYDGFSIRKIFDQNIKALQWIAAERGVELQIQVKKTAFPSLVWGDETAVFITIANSLILAVELESERILASAKYIPYEGLQIEFSASSSRFQEQFLSAISSGTIQDKPFPIAMVLQVLLKRLDCQFSQKQIDDFGNSIQFIFPLKLSEH